MAKHKPKIKEKKQPAKESRKLTAVPKIKPKQSNIISTSKEPTNLFARERLSIIRLDNNITLITKPGKTRKDSKVVAEYSKSAIGPYVIKFFDKKLQNKIEKILDVERLMKKK
jgi:hypothetical protein